MKMLLSVVAYLGIGVFWHALMIGPEFQPLNMWSWAWLIGWPFAIVIAQLAFISAVLLFVIVLALVVATIEAARS